MSQLSIEQSQAFVESLSLKPIHSGVLSGLKFAVKDNIDVKGCIPRNGNPTWRKTHPPSATHAICVEQLLQAGAECIGRTICSEFCFAIDGENHFYGTPLNPKAPWGPFTASKKLWSFATRKYNKPLLFLLLK